MTEIYQLAYPIIQGEHEIKSITIRKPTVGELRGLKLTELLQMDIATCEKLLPRITELTPADIINLDPYDFTMLMEKIAGFFVLLNTQSPTTY